VFNIKKQYLCQACIHLTQISSFILDPKSVSCKFFYIRAICFFFLALSWHDSPFPIYFGFKSYKLVPKNGSRERQKKNDRNEKQISFPIPNSTIMFVLPLITNTI